MHFCPRPRCRKWYHRNCLSLYPAAASAHVLLESSPDLDQPFYVSSEISDGLKDNPIELLLDGMSLQGKSEITLSSIPVALLKIAIQPIVRSGHRKATNAGGIAGNVRAVVAARRLVYAGLDGEDVGDWETKLNVRLDEVLAKLEGQMEVQVRKCPECHGPV